MFGDWLERKSRGSTCYAIIWNVSLRNHLIGVGVVFAAAWAAMI